MNPANTRFPKSSRSKTKTSEGDIIMICILIVYCSESVRYFDGFHRFSVLPPPFSNDWRKICGFEFFVSIVILKEA